MSQSVTIVFPSLSITPWGGAKMIFFYANHLAEKDFKVRIAFDCKDTLKKYPLAEQIRRAVCRLLVAINPRWYPLSSNIDKLCVFGVNDETIPDSDHVVATAVDTAYPVALLGKSKGRKHYLIQDYETWGKSEKYVDDTFMLGMSNIVVSGWLFDLVFMKTGIKPTLVRNPIDEAVFYPDGEMRHSYQVAVLYHEGEHKGFNNLYSALCQVKEKFPELKVIAFGSPKRPNWMPEWFDYTQNASETQLRRIYSSSAIYACATKNEGFGLTLAESMFCGCALVSTAFLGVFEYADQSCAFLSAPGDVDALASNLLYALSHSEERKIIAEKGRANAIARCSMKNALEAIDKEFNADE